MDLHLKAFAGAVHLLGIVTVLRKMYQPRFDLEEPIRVALDRMDCDERMRRKAARKFSNAA